MTESVECAVTEGVGLDQGRGSQRREFGLSFWEWEVVTLLVSTGIKRADAAKELAISTATLRMQVEQIHEKLGVRTRAELTALWASKVFP